MKDRVPLYPGRVKLTPVSGQENTYDMVRADEPTQEGTPLNKDSLLKDATAAMYGMPNTAVPDEVLAFLSKAALLDENGNVTDFSGVVKGVQIDTGSYAGTGTYGARNPINLIFSFTPKIVFVFPETNAGLTQANNNTSGTNLGLIAINGVNSFIVSYLSGTCIRLNITWSNKNISYYSEEDAAANLNEARVVYHYVAIG